MERRHFFAACGCGLLSGLFGRLRSRRARVRARRARCEVSQPAGMMYEFNKSGEPIEPGQPVYLAVAGKDGKGTPFVVMRPA